MKTKKVNTIVSKLCNVLLMALLFGWMMSAISCGENNHDYEIEYLPFQESKDGNWGMIAPNGEVLFSEEFKNKPSVAINGRFLVKNSDDLWEYYTTDAKPQKIGGEYLQAGLFYEDVAPVVEKGKPIQLIDKEGNVKVVLDKINGKAVTECSNFTHGLAMVKIEGFWGAIDTSGKLVIDPNYFILDISKNGYMIACDKKYQEEEFANRIFVVLDPNGKEVSSVKGSKVEAISQIWTSYHNNDYVIDDAIVIKVKKGDDVLPGLMKFDGEWLLKPSSKIKRVFAIRNNRVVFSDGENWGVVKTDGEEIIRPKFADLRFGDVDILVGKKSKEEGASLFTLEGEKIGTDEYEFISNFIDGKHAFAQASKSEFVLIDKEGKEIKLKTDLYYVEIFGAGVKNYFESDYVDLDDIVNSLQINKEGFLGLTTNMKGYQAVNRVNNIPGIQYTFKDDARQYAGKNNIWAKVKMHKLEGEIETIIRGLVNETRSGSGWWVTRNYSWSNKAVPSFDIHFDLKNNPQLEGRMRLFYEKIYEMIKKQGKEIASGKNATVIEVGDGIYYYAYWTGGRVALFYGSYDPESINVKEFDNASEDEFGTPLQPGRIIERFPTVDTDTIAEV